MITGHTCYSDVFLVLCSHYTQRISVKPLVTHHHPTKQQQSGMYKQTQKNKLMYWYCPFLGEGAGLSLSFEQPATRGK